MAALGLLRLLSLIVALLLVGPAVTPSSLWGQADQDLADLESQLQQTQDQARLPLIAAFLAEAPRKDVERAVELGLEAMDLLGGSSDPRTANVDLVLLDIMMPRMSGYEVCRRIREDYSREDLPVIFLSAKNHASDRIAGFEEGGNDYLAKPIAKQELLKRVETHLELLRSHRIQAEELKVLRGLLTICSNCKRIRDDDRWGPLETYIDNHSEATFSHASALTASKTYTPTSASTSRLEDRRACSHQTNDLLRTHQTSARLQVVNGGTQPAVRADGERNIQTRPLL